MEETEVTNFTDKFFWHRYLDEYEKLCFRNLKDPEWILEFGVLRGDSIRFFHERFPTAKIVGVDIAEKDSSWPESERISYRELDQDKRQDIKNMFMFEGHSYDLIIDDGSHLPQHQGTCLIDGLAALKSGGFYIVEDVHTNLDAREKPIFTSPLHILLVIEQLKKTNKTLPPERSLVGYFTWEEIHYLYNSLSEIKIYRRNLLPLKCWACKSVEFDYANLRCLCGQSLYENNDSMAAILRKV
jgi:hypothetical protein